MERVVVIQPYSHLLLLSVSMGRPKKRELGNETRIKAYMGNFNSAVKGVDKGGGGG